MPPRRRARRRSRTEQCASCSGHGHITPDCPRTDPVWLYKDDQIQPGLNFDKYKHVPVQVTTPTTTPGVKTEPVNEISNFDSYRSYKELHTNITHVDRCGYSVPTPVQRAAIPIIEQGYDVMGCAQTGTGKTAAYLIPVTRYLIDKKIQRKPVAIGRAQEPEVLILAPTRELARQIWKCSLRLLYKLPGEVSVQLVHGGSANFQEQAEKVRSGCNVLVATPGRLIRMIMDNVVRMEGVKVLVVDEADRMIDMGFESQIQQIMDPNISGMSVSTERQTLMFSATFREQLIELAQYKKGPTSRGGQYLKEDYRQLVAGIIGSAQPDVELFVENAEHDKKVLLKKILRNLLLGNEKTFLGHKCWDQSQTCPNIEDFLVHVLGKCSKKKFLIFVNQKKFATELADVTADYLFDFFADRFKDRQEFGHIGAAHKDGSKILTSYGAICMTGDMDQYHREAVLEMFRRGIYSVLIATDVVGRGIDIPGVTHVIIYDLPLNLHKFPGILEQDQNNVREGRISRLPKRNQIEEFVHRVGRTGRAGNTGTAIIFFEEKEDVHVAIGLVRILSEVQAKVPEWLVKVAESQVPSTKMRTPGEPPSVSVIRESLGDLVIGSVRNQWDDMRGPGEEELWGDSTDSK